MHGAAIGQIRQCIGTFDNGLEAIDMAATMYKNGILFTQTDVAKLTCSLPAAPFAFLR
jgi:hypothetical protein